MAGVLGELIGEGRTAQVFGFGEGRAVKLMREGFGSAALRLEAEKAAAAVKVGAPAPAVLGPIELEGRPGVIFERVDGPSMLGELVSGADAREMAKASADLHVRLFDCHTGGLPDVKELLAERIDEASGLSPNERHLAKQRLLLLPDGDSVLHGDFHPGNIHLTQDGPVLIDWIDSSRGSPSADVARTLLLVSDSALPLDIPNREELVGVVNRFRRAYFAQITGRRGLEAEAIEAWALPVAAARLSEGITHQEEDLRSRIRTLLAQTQGLLHS